MEFKRPTWDEYFMTIAKLTRERSNCIRRRVGCIIVKDNRILSLGYNGTPKGTQNCYEGGCERCANVNATGRHLDLCMCLHAEENALLYVSSQQLQDSTMYVSLLPCISCVKKILQCGVKRVVYWEKYSPELDSTSISILEQHGVTVDQLI